MSRSNLRAAIRLAGRLSIFGFLFLAAGRLDWWQGWLFTGLFLATMAVNLALLARFNPEVIRLRMKPIRPERGFDRVFVTGGLLLYLALLLLAGLDSGRFGWSGMDTYWTVLGAVLFVAGMVPVTWSLLANRFIATTVCIQTERGHKVVTDGPYRVVRHPMYSGLLVVYLSTPFILGSWWALVPAILLAFLLIYRTAQEDRALRAELDGYEEFTHQTPYRLIAHVW